MVYCPNPVCPQPQNLDSTNFCQACGSRLTVGDRYRLSSLLGKGGFGRTFLARQLSDASEVQNLAYLGDTDLCVVKQIYPAPESKSKGLSFEAEAERLRRLGEHPQIPRLLEAIASNQGQFLIQEYAPGQNLQQQVEADGPWTEGRVRSLLESLVKVLQYVHSFGIIHRDIKPANIVSASVHNNQKTDSPMLVDFGAAKSIRHSEAKTVIGSAGYAAPEQSMGQATFASDVYSLGLSCLYLLTGLHPFKLYSAVEDRWVWQDYLPTPVEGRFAQVLKQMVERSLQQRYESMEQVVLDLQLSQNLLFQNPLSQTSLVKGSQKIISRAKESVPGLGKIVSTGSSMALRRLRSVSQQRLAKPAPSPVAKIPTQSWQRRHRLAPEIGLVRSLAISPSGQTFASGGVDGAVRLWETASGRLVHSFAKRFIGGTGHAATVTALAFHPDGRALYSASEDGAMKEWDSTRRSLLNTMPTAGWLPTDLLVTPDGTQLVSPNSDGQIVTWNIDTLLPAERLTQHQKRVTAVKMSRAGNLLVSASDDGTVKLWKRQRVGGNWRFRLAKSLTIAQSTLPKALEGGGAVGLALQTSDQSASNRLVVATRTEVFWYSVDSQLGVSAPVSLYRSAYSVKAITLSKDGYLAVGSEDRIVTLWDIATGKCVATLAHDWGVGAIAFTPDSQTLITASTDEVISIWQRDR